MVSNGECVFVRGFAFVCLVVPIALNGCFSLSLGQYLCASLPRSVLVLLYLGLYTRHSVLQCLHLCLTYYLQGSHRASTQQRQ